jgi:hypothetical protein
MLSVIYDESRYAECHKLALYAECLYAECCYAECRYAECRHAECRGTLFIIFLSIG